MYKIEVNDYTLIVFVGCDSIPTDSFKGLRVFVHNADDFPAVAERGYIVGPGMETQVGVTAVDTYSGDVLRGFSAKTRGCFFPDEFPLKFYKEYSRSACIVECETEFVFQECQCVTYFSPGNYSVCTLKKFQECVKKALDAIQKKNLPTAVFESSPETTMFNFKSKKDREQDKSCAQFCLPSCNETFYNVFVTAADFPNQPLANQTKMLREAIVEGGLTHLNDISYVSGSISVLRIFFRESSIMQYKRDELFTWEDFVSAWGGVMSLCMGFSITSLVEAIYFFTFRMHLDKKKMRENKTVAEFVN
ncbi:pickpocket protein 28 [Folsomia candida]|uniref:pickpocket protein 28 n=1 Tax=Folsomia candida TaxID=158441 RepID=UPI000B8F40E2|nr:pickpocket protein 28 [Folsomia candida]